MCSIKKSFYSPFKMVTISFVLLCVFCLDLHAQVNTEVLRRSREDLGFSNRIAFNYGYYTGNSNFYKLKLNLRSDYTSEKYYSFLVVDFQKARKDEGAFINKGFAHLRWVLNLSPMYMLEAFIQRGFDDFIQLKSRNLIGCGTRIRIIEYLSQTRTPEIFLGIGLMGEKEILNLSQKHTTTLLRSTNYISFKWNVGDRLGLISTIYFQPYIKNLDDYRILSSQRAVVNISDRVALTIDLSVRYDNDPPVDIRKRDLELINGLIIEL